MKRLAIVLLLLCACSNGVEYETGAIVSLVADESITSAVRTLRVVVHSGDPSVPKEQWEERGDEMVDVEEWPAEIAIAATDPDRKWTADIEAFDKEGRKRAGITANGNFVKGKIIRAELMLNPVDAVAQPKDAAVDLVDASSTRPQDASAGDQDAGNANGGADAEAGAKDGGAADAAIDARAEAGTDGGVVDAAIDAGASGPPCAVKRPSGATTFSGSFSGIVADGATTRIITGAVTFSAAASSLTGVETSGSFSFNNSTNYLSTTTKGELRMDSPDRVTGWTFKGDYQIENGRRVPVQGTWEGRCSSATAISGSWAFTTPDPSITAMGTWEASLME